ncbi:hypothetical protein [Pseudomonas chlororaphis]|uniref:hypothetical protein n=1 Tax=Pseudomonas chlororaphis TaxID=587753 RepID=UPI000472D6E2|nr:hypothetical protein [Pseudomonas chlororaphis]
MTDYIELRRVAEAAENAFAQLCQSGGDDLAEAWSKAETEFANAANPAEVLALIAENERLSQFEQANTNWLEKTEWVQKTCHWSELGKHRADVLRERIEQFQAGFKNFHCSLCKRFGYYHDDIDWQRDQVSLEEHIAAQFGHVSAENSSLRGQMATVQRGAGQLKAENEALRKSLIDLREALEREYWNEYAGLDETRSILDAAVGKEAAHG